MANGRLYIVATPIGNLGDLSPRAIEMLRNADVVAAEDTRHSGMLLKHFDIESRLVSYHEHNEAARANELIVQLKSGVNVALISDAGTPCISDPGYRLVRAARAAGIEVVTVPGPSAPIAALSISGLPCDTFTFHGFFPKKAGRIEQTLDMMRNVGGTHIYFESPKRVRATIDAIGASLQNAQLALARELTKLHEEVITGTAEEIETALDGREVKGECVLIVHVPRVELEISDEELRALVEKTAAENSVSLRDAVKTVATELGIPKNRVYAAAIADNDKNDTIEVE